MNMINNISHDQVGSDNLIWFFHLTTSYPYREAGCRFCLRSTSGWHMISTQPQTNDEWIRSASRFELILNLDTRSWFNTQLHLQYRITSVPTSLLNGIGSVFSHSSLVATRLPDRVRREWSVSGWLRSDWSSALVQLPPLPHQLHKIKMSYCTASDRWFRSSDCTLIRRVLKIISDWIALYNSHLCLLQFINLIHTSP